ncbi:hypothetical protein FRC16_006817, partial [Serendipita sp. 398]
MSVLTANANANAANASPVAAIGSSVVIALTEYIGATPGPVVYPLAAVPPAAPAPDAVSAGRPALSLPRVSFDIDVDVVVFGF